MLFGVFLHFGGQNILSPVSFDNCHRTIIWISQTFKFFHCHVEKPLNEKPNKHSMSNNDGAVWIIFLLKLTVQSIKETTYSIFYVRPGFSIWKSVIIMSVSVPLFF